MELNKKTFRILRWAAGTGAVLWALVVIFTDGATEIPGVFGILFGAFLLFLGLEYKEDDERRRGFSYMCIFAALISFFFALNRFFGVLP